MACSCRRVDKIGDAGSRIDCDGFRAQADTDGPGFVKITVPRSCVGTPDRVRVTIRGYYAVPGPNIIDWAPGTKKFTDCGGRLIPTRKEPADV